MNRTLKDLGINENVREDHKEIGCEDVGCIQFLRIGSKGRFL